MAEFLSKGLRNSSGLAPETFIIVVWCYRFTTGMLARNQSVYIDNFKRLDKLVNDDLDIV